ncbi:hypothetical protein [Lichenibacterium minor]|uniref:hypothetical protein n=1 Tax=Lichenibacterium minor TaxID=2316528 RepID=UPI0013EC4E2A|nr:hypothetical protein [Lichenibacterium minor]
MVVLVRKRLMKTQLQLQEHSMVEGVELTLTCMVLSQVLRRSEVREDLEAEVEVPLKDLVHRRLSLVKEGLEEVEVRRRATLRHRPLEEMAALEGVVGGI